jgi:mannonate dehydratase
MPKEQIDMHLALTLNPFIDSDLQYAQQLGVHMIVGDLPAWDFDTLASARNRVEKSGLTLCALECLPSAMVTDALLGQPEGEGVIDQICQIITDMGALCIPTLGYRWPVADECHDMDTIPGRGESISRNYKILDATYDASDNRTREESWQALAFFLQRVVPIAVTSGVRLAYHTDISLVSLPESNRILDSVAELDRLFQVADSPYHGLDLDQGFLTQVLAKQVAHKPEQIIRHYCQGRRIFAIRMHSLRRKNGGVVETFLDENKVEIISALQAYQAAGYAESLRPIPSPAMADDTEWRHKGQAYSIGYLRGLLQVIS